MASGPKAESDSFDSDSPESSASRNRSGPARHVSSPGEPWWRAHDGADPLGCLADLGQVLAASADARAGLGRALEVFVRGLGALHARIALLDVETGRIDVIAAAGASFGGESSTCKLGEGITGRVIASGKPIVVPRVSRDPLLLPAVAGQSGEFVRVRDEGDRAYLCFPLAAFDRTEGAFAALFTASDTFTFELAAKLMKIAAALFAQALKVDRLTEAQRVSIGEQRPHLQLQLQERYDYANIAGQSAPMRQVYEQISQVARTNTTALVRGESGTGKELIAHAIHYNSPRAKRPFIKVSCGALPETLIESELFGYERGAFTGATNRKKGRFELAEGGTLFLDEVGDLSIATQVKLLRVLQAKEFERLGGTETIKSNVRLVAATNRDMEKAIASGTFREDLYYRLNVFTIFLPPLRDRSTDILLLADHFVSKYSSAHGKVIRRLSASAADLLSTYPWPGNVRELENTMERAVVVCDGSVIQGHHLPKALQSADITALSPKKPLAETVGEFEKGLIEEALRSTRGNRARAARLLGTSERILSYKVSKYGLESTRFRS